MRTSFYNKKNLDFCNKPIFMYESYNESCFSIVHEPSFILRFLVTHFDCCSSTLRCAVAVSWLKLMNANKYGAKGIILLTCAMGVQHLMDGLSHTLSGKIWCPFSFHTGCQHAERKLFYCKIFSRVFSGKSD